MALVIADRVKETTTTTGTGNLDLAGAVSGFQSFVSGIGDTNTVYYALIDANGSAWEVGLGTVSDGDPDTLSRPDNASVIASTNSNNRISLSSGTHTVFATYAAGKAVYLDASGNLSHTVDISSDTNLVGGTGITLTGDTLSTTDSEIVHDNLSGFVANEHIDWTTDQGSTNIHAGNYTDTNTMGSGFTVSATTDTTATTITEGEDLFFAAGTGITCATTADGTVTISCTVTDTNTMGSGFTVSATTDSNATTITQGDDLMFAAGTGITCETTADGTVTISCTVTDTNTTYSAATSSALGLVKLEDNTEQSVAANAVSATASRTYGIQLNSSDQAVVNVPWTDTNTNTMGSGFTVSATTDTTATTIVEGEDLFFAAGTGITCETTADGTVTISCTVTDTNTQLSQDQVEDYVNGLLTEGSNVTLTYDDAAGTLTIASAHPNISAASSSDNSGRTYIQDITVDSNGHVTGIATATETVTDTNTMGSGFTVSATTDSNATTITQGDDLMFTAGTGITCETTADGTVTISCTVTDTNTTYTKASFDVDHLFTLVGASADTDEHLGTFTGSTIADNQTIKAAIQAVETAVETKGATAGSSSILTVGALDAGSITSGFGNIDNGSSSIACGSLDVSDGNITSVGDINCDSVSVDDPAVGLDIVFGGNTTLNKMTLTDNLADALNITEGSNSYIKICTTNASTGDTPNAEKIHFGQAIVGAINTATDGGAVTIDCSKGNYHEILMNATATSIVFTNAAAGQRIIVRFKQHSSHIDLDSNDGFDTVTVNNATATVTWPGGTIPTLTETNDAVDVYGFQFQSTVTNVHAFIIGQNLS